MSGAFVWQQQGLTLFLWYLMIENKPSSLLNI